MELNLKGRQKLTAVTARKYRTAKKSEKTKTLFAFTGQTGYNRKHATRILANEGKIKTVKKELEAETTQKRVKKRICPATYDEAVQGAPALVWEAFNRQCGKLPAPFPRLNIDAIAKEPKFSFSRKVATKLRKISASAVDRLLVPIKAGAKIKGTSGTKPAAQHLKKLVPVLSHFECVEQGSGLWQIGLVQHDGGNPSGEFCYTC
ncbi:MAG: hypothetical protein LBH43_00730 [Treponema sp.]|jgi:hypothetical protein|nr:hypothetical protein [Treponema sp.]